MAQLLECILYSKEEDMHQVLSQLRKVKAIQLVNPKEAN
jgi:hypothetical protein